jgi:Fe-S-cluster containining protein
MAVFDQSDPLAFFKTLHHKFCETLTSGDDQDLLIERLLKDCFEDFECSCANAAELACHGGCASCCTIRVAATAPEILLIASVVRAFGEEMQTELRQRIRAADKTTMQLDEQSRMAAGYLCPFIDNSLCLIYAVRPLACRGHASYDEQACIDALAGKPSEIPISLTHMTVRSLVQNSMQSALRDHGFAWGIYELNQALQIALTNETCEVAWVAGDDVFQAASINDVSAEEMALTFDAIKAHHQS